MNLLLLLVILNKWIYTPDKVVLPSGIESIFYDQRVGVLKTENNSCYIVHRGTWSMEDILYDLESEIYQSCNENGFLEAFYESYEHDHNVDMLITDKACDEVYYTGHSLGGVTARMASVFATHNVPIKQLVTFGEPRSCCKGKKNVLKHSIRVINGNDPIPVLPTGATPQHCCPTTLTIPYGVWHNSSSFPNIIPKHPMYSVYKYHRISRYELSTRRYINKSLMVNLLKKE